MFPHWKHPHHRHGSECEALIKLWLLSSKGLPPSQSFLILAAFAFPAAALTETSTDKRVLIHNSFCNTWHSFNTRRSNAPAFGGQKRDCLGLELSGEKKKGALVEKSEMTRSLGNLKLTRAIWRWRERKKSCFKRNNNAYISYNGTTTCRLAPSSHSLHQKGSNCVIFHSDECSINTLNYWRWLVWDFLLTAKRELGQEFQ